MPLESSTITVLWCSIVLVVCSALLPAASRRAAFLRVLFAAMIGAVVYPIALVLIMSVGAAMFSPRAVFWHQIRISMAHVAPLYSDPAVMAEILPRGAGIGILVVVSWTLTLRRRRSQGTPSQPRPGRLKRVGVVFVGMVLVYALSSGPVIAIAFRLRESTGRDEFFGVMYPYIPLVNLGGDLVDTYIRWWINRLGVLPS